MAKYASKHDYHVFSCNINGCIELFFTNVSIPNFFTTFSEKLLRVSSLIWGCDFTCGVRLSYGGLSQKKLFTLLAIDNVIALRKKN